MKTVIVQSFWGRGMMVRSKSTDANLRALKAHCIPSVQRYAARHGYSYIMHRPERLHFNFPLSDDVECFSRQTESNRAKVNSLMTQDMFDSMFEPYYVMNELASLYERMICLDLDIYIKPTAPAMPPKKGVWAFAGHYVPYHHMAAFGFHEVPPKRFFNGGVIVMDGAGARDFYRYLKKTKVDSRCRGSDNYFDLWALQHKVHLLEEKWNHITHYHDNIDGHFIHYIDKTHINRDHAPLLPFDRDGLHYRKEMLYKRVKKTETVLRRSTAYRSLRRLLGKKQKIIASEYETPTPQHGIKIVKNSHQGKRCFIVGTAPSVAKLDLSLLKNDYVFSVNRGYLLLQKQNLPHINFYALSDMNAINSYGDEINCAAFDHMFLIGNVHWQKDARNISTFKLYARAARETYYMRHGFFQWDVKKPLAYSSMVVLHQLQIAVWLGFKTIYFIGVDNDFSAANMHFYKDTPQEQLHMGSYVPPLLENEGSFRAAHALLAKRDIELYNATSGGRLEALPRVAYETLF